MKMTILVFAASAVLFAGEPQAKKPVTQYPTTRAEVPKGAVEREPGRFYYTDSDGKKWIYVRTPFGASRIEDKGEATAVAKADPFENVKITESGNIVTFERSVPFGVSKWQKKKSELTEEELAAVNRSRSAAPKQDR